MADFADPILVRERGADRPPVFQIDIHPGFPAALQRPHALRDVEADTIILLVRPDRREADQALLLSELDRRGGNALYCREQDGRRQSELDIRGLTVQICALPKMPQDQEEAGA